MGGWVAMWATSILLGCDSAPMGPAEAVELPRQLTVSETQVVEASNDFAFRLARAVSHPDSTFFLGPVSTSMALGMAMNGAEGATLSQMRATLGFEGLSDAEVNRSYRDLSRLLVSLDPEVEIALANSVWLRDDFEPRSEFIDVAREYFDAVVETLDFDAPDAPDRINGWVDLRTRGEISEIVPSPLPTSTRTYLINAMYFHSDWRLAFDHERTRSAPFHLRDGSTVSVELMHRPEAPVAYASRADFQVAELPYGGDAFAMTIVLPAPGADVEGVLAALDGGDWNALVASMGQRSLAVSLPRFELAYERTLNDDLVALGMSDAFDPHRADFARLSDERLMIEEVKHKTLVRVTEDGTTAAAATSVGIGPTSAPPEFRVDRPFIFAIRERLTGTILFLGKVVDPS